MSHHGSGSEGPSAELRKAFMEMFGEYPAGRLNDRDEGACPLMIGAEAGRVVMRFYRPTAWIAFTPEQAVEIAQALIKQARATATKPLTVTIG